MVESGLNSNYASSWHMTRCEPTYSVVGTVGTDNSIFLNSTTTGSLKNRSNGAGTARITVGPLTNTILDRTDIPSASIAFLGCADKGDNKDAFLGTEISRTLKLTRGALLAETQNDGPSASSTAANYVKNAASGLTRGSLMHTTLPIAGENVTDFGVSKSLLGGNLYLQDTRDWRAYHNGYVNVSFADGSVRTLQDVNLDGYINPGFTVPTATTTSGERARLSGYTDSFCESNPWDLYSGVHLQGFEQKTYE
jgi:prepilin-type processing-associated H-X9-DG protein